VSRCLQREQTGDSEVDDAVARGSGAVSPFVCNHHVVGLQIAVDDLVLVEVLEGLEQLAPAAHGFVFGEAVGGGDLGERASDDELFHEVDLARFLERIDEARQARM